MNVLTVGTFDLFHPGHVFLLAQCKRLAGADGNVIVGVNTDTFVASFKPPPAQTVQERIIVLEACRYVDCVITNNSASLASMISALAPDVLAIGQDWAVKDYYAQIGVTQAWLDSKNVSLIYIPRPAGTMSSTELRGRVRGSNVRGDAVQAQSA